MGTIRTLLAISVVFAHTFGVVIVGGKLAVELFYFISGFLISYVLLEAKTYTSKTGFYLNRFYRLFPVYWLVAILSLLVVLYGNLYLGVQFNIVDVYSEIDWFGRIILTLSNFFLLGQDWVMFTAVHDHVLGFSANFRDTEIKVWRGLIAPQGWTLGVELSFYAVAPFILPRRKLLYLCIILSLFLRLYLVIQGVGLNDPWSYRFFPTELALFLFGSLSHQLWMPYVTKKGWLTERNSTSATVCIFIFCSIYFLLPFKFLSALMLMATFFVVLPFLFNFQKSNKWDAKVGELSYPVYISHFLIIWIFDKLLKEIYFIDISSITGALVVVLFAVLFSYLMNKFVGRLVDKLREGVKLSQTR